MQKTEEQIYNEIVAYINSKKHNRPCTLATIKKNLRTPKIIDLIFSHPDIFILPNEIKHVPNELMTDELAMRVVLSHPYNYSLLNEEQLTVPVFLAYEISKRRYEYVSSKMWGQWGEKLSYSGKIVDYLNEIKPAASEISKTLTQPYDVNEIVSAINSFVSQLSSDVQPIQPYTPKYNSVKLNSNKKVLILISGMPDSGKTTFSQLLSSVIEESTFFDSDMLLEAGMLSLPDSILLNLYPENIIIFSDTDASKFFAKTTLGNYDVINIVMKPKSLEEAHRNSKLLNTLSFDEYKQINENKYKYNDVSNPIIVENDYLFGLYEERDNVIEEIQNRLRLNLNSQPNQN